MSLKRRIFTKEFKQQIIREVQVGKSIAQASRENELHPNLIAKWQKSRAAPDFLDARRDGPRPGRDGQGCTGG